MTIAQQIRSTEQRFQIASRAGEFVALSMALAQARGSPLHAAELAAAARQPSVRDVLAKAAAGAETLASLADYRLIAAGFSESLVNISCFQRMLPSMRVVPVATAVVGAVNTGATAYVIGEGGAKPISNLSLSNGQLTPTKAAGIVIATAELLRFGGKIAADIFAAELQAAVGLATDLGFISSITSGIALNASSGATAATVVSDLAVLLAAVPTGARSKLFILTTSAICKTWSLLTAINGEFLFPDLRFDGGEIQGLPVLVSDGVPAGRVLLADASQIAAGSGDLVLDDVRHSTVQMDTAPDSPPTGATPLVSLWQQDLVGLRCERWFGCQRLRPTAVAGLSGVVGGNSP